MTMDTIHLSIPSLRRPRHAHRSSHGLARHIALVIALLGAAAFGLWQTTLSAQSLSTQAAAAAEAARPADLTITVITAAECAECADITNYLDFIKSKNVNIVSTQEYTQTSSEAQQLIAQYRITKLPTLLVSGELTKDADLAAAFANLGTTENGTFVMRNQMPPYRNLALDSIEGLVDVTYLTDRDCADCYDVMMNRGILTGNYAMHIANEQTIDISDPEGAALVAQYNITKVPTFLLSNQTAVYQLLMSVWKNVGSIEPDSTYVFRSVEQLGTYHDLESDAVVAPQAANDSADTSNK